jgi:hypothetical protein
MMTKKQLILNLAILTIALTAGAGTLYTVYAQSGEDTCPTGLKTFYRDADGDGYGNPADSIQACTQPAGYVENNTDCNDANATLHPNATEVCNNLDDNCSGQADEGLATSTYYYDADSDTYGTTATTTVWCALPDHYSATSSDCNDNNVAVHPNTAELCNGIDDNCDGVVDEGCVTSTFYRDADGDGYGNLNDSISATNQPAGYVINHTDCNDSSAAIHPGATEICNGVDDNCNGQIDEGVKTTYYYDADGDSYGSTATSTQACSVPNGYVTDHTDCNDSNAAIHPGATELCDGVDNNCSGQIDEGCNTTTFYRDADGDGYGNPNESIQAAVKPSGYVADNTDCNDSNAAIHPGATEVCNGIDDNCNGQIDEGVKTTYYYDADGDSYGGTATSTQACSAPSGYVVNNTDCNDSNAAIHPGATEVCDGIDNDCDGVIDEGCTNQNCPPCPNQNNTYTCTCQCQCSCTVSNVNNNENDNHSACVSCAAHNTNQLKWQGDITGKIKGEIVSQVAKQIDQNENNQNDNKRDFKFEFKFKGKQNRNK